MILHPNFLDTITLDSLRLPRSSCSDGQEKGHAGVTLIVTKTKQGHTWTKTTVPASSRQSRDTTMSGEGDVALSRYEASLWESEGNIR